MQASETQSSRPEYIQPELVATEHFTQMFIERYGTMHMSGNTDLEDMQASAREDIPRAIAEGDLGGAQEVLEGGWSLSDRRLKSERLEALRELHIAEKGVPTTEQRIQAAEDLKTAIQGTSTERYKEGADTLRVVLSGSGGDAKEIEAAIDHIEWLINEENVGQRNPRRAESLRIARDIQVERWVRERSHVSSRDEVLQNLTDLVGRDNEAFPGHKIQALVPEGWAAGVVPLEHVQRITSMAQAEKNLHRKMDLLHNLAHGRIPITDPAAMEKWYADQHEQELQEANMAQQQHIAQARAQMAKVLQDQEQGGHSA